MERKIGEIFTMKKRKYQVVKSSLAGGRCSVQCSLHGLACWDMERQTGTCSMETRKDKNDAVFKEVTNVTHINDITDLNIHNRK